MRYETRLHKLAMNAPDLMTFLSEIRRFPKWVLTEDQRRYSVRDFRVFFEAIKGGK